MEYAILIPSAFGYHPVTVFNLAGINVVDFFAAMLLADPSRRAVVLDGLLVARSHVTNGQCRLVLADPDYNGLPPRRLRCLRPVGRRLRQPPRRQRDNN